MSINTLKITSCKSQITKLESYVSQIRKQFGINEDKYPDILISLTEAVNNAIIHGNRNNINKCVDIYCQCNDGVLTFKISDEGKGFNPQEIKDPLSDENLDQEGGRGVFIMESLCDCIKYYDKGSTVEMTFKIS